MRKLLILIVAVFCSAATLYAQVPRNISSDKPIKPKFTPHNPDLLCNFAGTFTLGIFTGQSNDTDLTPPSDTIYLCQGDRIQINHNGDSDLSGDPQPATPPGIGWVFYDCPPTIAGDALASIIADPCVINTPPATNGIWVATDQPSGSIQFVNDGTLQTFFNAGNPILIHFAPITLDDFAAQGFENGGNCVNVNTAVEFKVVYLNEIEPLGLLTNVDNDDCQGRFSIAGGYPEFQAGATYDIRISLVGNPSIKGLIHTAKNKLFHNSVVYFSVPQSGTYEIVVEDGKSCGLIFQVDMNACNPADNVVFDLPEAVVPPNDTVCIPLTVQNLDAAGVNFSVSWDPTVVNLTEINNYNPALGANPVQTVTPNFGQVSQGQLGVVIFQTSGAPITLVNGDTLFSLCFQAVGQLNACSPLLITNDPTAIQVEDATGLYNAVTADTGNICVNFLPLSIIADTVSINCADTASIKVTASGGIAPYEVLFQKLPAGPIPSFVIATDGGMFTRTGLTNGVYSVCVTDEGGIGTQTRCDTVTIDIQTIGASLDLTQMPKCSGDLNGIVTANVFEGSTAVNPPTGYTFAWSPSGIPPVTGPVRSGVGAGAYGVTITSPTGCVATASGTLGQPTVVSRLTVTTTPATCTGVEDGSISYSAKGGTPFPTAGNEYQYTWSYLAPGSTTPIPQGSSTTNPNVLSSKAGGKYYVTVSDANGCAHIDSVTIVNTRTMDVQGTAITDTKCLGTLDGAIDISVVVTPPFAVPNFTYTWSPTGGTETNNSTTATYSDLAAGTYLVSVVDITTGCSDSASFVVNAPNNPIKLNGGEVDPTCTGVTNGSISLSAMGGTGFPNYIYTWESASGATLPNGPNQNGLSAGTYTATATDANGCQDSLTFTLELPPAPVITQIDSTSVACGSDGCLTATATAATTTTFTWTTLGGAPVGTTAQVCDLSGGTYIVKVSDVLSCMTSDTIFLDTLKNPLRIANTTLINPTCAGGTDGSIAIGVVGGQPNYIITWTPGGGTGQILTGLSARPYIVTVVDLAGCVLTDTLTLVNPPGINVSSSNIMGTTCSDSCNGRAIILANFQQGSTAIPGDFTFAWSDGNSTDSVRVDLCPGTFTVTVTDSKNCFNSTQVFIQSPAAVDTSSLVITPANCFGGDEGSITVTADQTSGNGGPFMFTWSTGSTLNTVQNLQAGNYTVTIKDSQGCSNVFAAVVTEPAQIIVTPSVLQVISCYGAADGQLEVDVIGGNAGGFNYTWSPSGNTNPLTDLAAGTYDVTVTDKKQCTGTGSISLTDPTPVLGSLNALDTIQCFGDEIILSVDTITGGAGGPYEYSVDNGVRVSKDFPITIGGGDHLLTYYDKFGCFFTDTITIPEPAPITITFSAPTIEIELGESALLDPIIGGLIGTGVYAWSPAEFVVKADTIPTFTKSYETNIYTLLVTDANGCTGTGTITVNVDPNRNVYIPNAFMPDNDRGTNYTFSPQVGNGVELVNFMQVYDRWGELMYTRDMFFPNNDNFSDGWDGRYNGDLVNPGVYVYVIEVKFLDGRVLLYRGDITVVR